MVAAGFLLAPTVATYAKNFPNVNFAITDYTSHEPPFATKSGKVLPMFKNVAGLTYAAERGGLPRRCALGQDGARSWAATDRRRWRLNIPPVDIYIAGYKYCGNKAVPGTKMLVQYSNDFGADDKCQAVAENEIASGREGASSRSPAPAVSAR